MTNYTHQSHIVYHHRYHLVWITTYRYLVMRGAIGEHIHNIIFQVSEELGIKIINGVVSAKQLYLFVSIPPHIAVSNFLKKAQGRSSRKIQQEFPELRRGHWGKHFWGRGYFSTTSDNATNEIIDAYIQ